MTNRCDPARYERGIFRAADANRHVESVFDEIDKTVVQNELDIHPRMSSHEFADGRRETENAERHRSRDAQSPDRLTCAVCPLSRVRRSATECRRVSGDSRARYGGLAR